MGACVTETEFEIIPMFTLDTNAVIYYAAGDKNISALLLKHKEAIFYLPSIVVAEFLSYPLIDEHSATLFRLFTQQTIVVNLDLQISELAAELRRAYNLKLADAIIAATAVSTNSTLLTRNIRDFKKVPRLTFLKI